MSTGTQILVTSYHCNYTLCPALSVPPPVVINNTLINGLDELYEYYDSQLSSTLDKADSMISQIEFTTETTWTDYLAYASCGLSAFNFIIFCIVLHSAVTNVLFAADLLTSQAPYSLNPRHLKAQNLLCPNHPTATEFASVV